MNGWFITLIILYTLRQIYATVQHGKERTENINCWITLGNMLLYLFLIYKAIQTGF